MIKDEIKSAISDKSVTFGSKQVLKKLKEKTLKAVVFATNCPEETKKDITKYCHLSNTKFEEFDNTGKQLGIFCGKPFSIAVLGISEKRKK